MQKNISKETLENFNPKELQALKDGIIDKIAKLQFGEAWDKFSKTEKETNLKLIATNLSAIKDANLSVEEFFKLGPAKQTQIISNYENKCGFEISPSAKIAREVIIKLNKKNVTNEDIEKYLINKQKHQKLTKDELLELKKIGIIKNNKNPKIRALYKKGHLDASASLDYLRKEQFKGDDDKWCHSVLGNLTKEQIRDLRTNKNGELAKLLEKINDPEAQRIICQHLGVSSKVMKQLEGIIYPNVVEELVDATVRCDGARAARCASIDADFGGDAKGLIGLAKENQANNVEFNTDFNTSYLQERNSADDIKNITAMDNKYLEQSTLNQVNTNVAQSEKLSPATISQYAKSSVETATSPEQQLQAAQTFANSGNYAALEGVAAATNSVDKSVRNQYTTVVQNAAKNYPPEQQKAINNATKSGNISQETLSKTTPQSSTSNNTASQKSEAQTSTSQTTKAQSSQKTTSSSAPTKGNTNNTTAPQQGSSRVTSSTPAVTSPISSSNTIGTNDVGKQATLERIAEVKNKIENSIREWEDAHARNLTVEEAKTLKALAAVSAVESTLQDSEHTESEKEQFIKSLANATTLSDIYDILVSTLGSSVHSKFIEVLASYGSSDDVSSFINSKSGNTELVEELFDKCSSTSLQKELLTLLPENTVFNLISENKIPDLTIVDHKILYDYIRKNPTLGRLKLNQYLKYLPADEQRKILAMRGHLAQNVPAESAAQSSAQQTTEQEAQGLTQPQQTQQTTPPLFANGETRKTLADGRIITNQGTSFGAVSNTSFDEEYRVVTPQEQGAPIGMNDEILTPGSPEWLRKYNRQQAPATAFTMASLEDEEEDFGLGAFGSNKVRKSLKINKKFPKDGFNFRA